MTPRRWPQGILGIFLLVFGVLWVLQGLNIVGGSFMTGQTIWLIIGIIVALFGMWLLWTLRSGTGKADVG